MSKLQELKNKLEYPLLNEFRKKKIGVEYKKLGDVAEIKGRIGFRGYTRKDLRPEGEGAISLSPRNIINNNINYLDNTYISWEKYEESPEIMINEGDVIFCKTASIGKVAIIENLPQKATINPQLVVFKNIKCNNKFLKYIITGQNFQYNVNKLKGVGTVSSISQEKLGNIEIPIPPLEVQKEIVRILDPFTKNINELVELLQREKELRKKQYAYYRDKLLTFEEDVKKVKLEEICEKIKNINWKQENNISKKYIDLSSVSREFHAIIDDEITEVNSENAPSRAKQIIKTNDILFGTTRPMLKRFCIVPKKYNEQICSTGFCVLRINNEDVLVNYIYHYLSTSNFYNFIKDNEQGTTYPAISDNILKKYKIPLPPLEKQKEIASILDNFDKYTNSLQEGLPAEIEARKKQYEFYRDKLLTFERIN